MRAHVGHLPFWMGNSKPTKWSTPIICPPRRMDCVRRTRKDSCAPNAADAWPLHPMVRPSSANIARVIKKLAMTQPAGEKDFIIAMATSRGHGKPLQEQVFHCNGCGAEFILPPKQISASCVYCDSPYVVSLEKTKDLLAPDGIIPHAFTQKHAIKLLVDWVEGNDIQPEKKVELPRGLYLPLWTFDIGGVIDYTGEKVEYENELFTRRGQKKIVRVTDQYPVMVDDLPLPASRKLSSVFVKLISTFDRKSIQPYDPRFLANWPAEIYDVPMADASLDARSQAYASYKEKLPSLLNDMTHCPHFIIEPCG